MISVRGAARSIIPVAPAAWGPMRKPRLSMPSLRVHGVQNLRVCDASVFPNIVAGNLNAPAMMVGWKGAAIILQE